METGMSPEDVAEPGSFHPDDLLEEVLAYMTERAEQNRRGR